VSKKNKKEEKKPESKPLLNSQMELLGIKMQRINQVNEILQQRKIDVENSINLIALENGVPEEQLGEWGLSEDGRSLVYIGKQKAFPGLRTVKKREEKKGKNKEGGNGK